MTKAQLDAILEFYHQQLASRGVPAIKDGGPLAHAHWMVQMARELSLEKANRWLGFVQGVLWCEKVFTVDEMRDQTRKYLG